MILSDTLFITKDSLYIQGNGTRLVRDSAGRGKGLAIRISPTSRHIVIDNLVLEDFGTGILADNSAALQVSNLRFRNTPVAVAYGSSSDTLSLTGRFRQEGPRDSLPKKYRK